MADNEIAAGGSGDDVARFVALTERQHELWTLLRDAPDDETRNQVFDELTANRQELDQLKGIVEDETGEVPRVPPPREEPRPAQPRPKSPRSVGEQLRAQLVTEPGGVAPPQPPPPPPPPVTFETPTTAPEPEPLPKEPASEAVDAAPSDTEAATPPLPREDPAPRPAPSRPDPAPAPPPPSKPEPPRPAPAKPEPPQSAPPKPAPPEPEPARPAEPSPEEPAERLRDELPQPPLPPEDTPFRSRADDIAALRRRNASKRRLQPRVSDDFLEERRQAAHDRFEQISRVRQHRSRVLPILAIVIAVAAVAVVVWFTFFYERGTAAPPTAPPTTTTTTTAPPVTAPPENVLAAVQAVLEEFDYGTVEAIEQVGTIVLSGWVPTDADLEIVVDAVETLAGTKPVDSSRLTVAPSDLELRALALEALAATEFLDVDVSVLGGVAIVSGVVADENRADLISAVAVIEGVVQVVDIAATRNVSAQLSAELRRITGTAPIVFESGQLDVSEQQQGALDDIAAAILAHEGPYVTLAGYTDPAGSAAENQQLSQIRSERVRDYLISQGVPADRLIADGRGEELIPGTVFPAGLERRVEFEASFALPPGVAADFRIGIVTATGRNDLSSAQSIVTAADVIAGERGDVAIGISDGVPVEGAAAALRALAADGYDLVVAHGADYGPALVEVAGDFPETAFVWGPGSGTFGLSNVTAYNVSAGQGAYVLGVMAASITESEVIGIVGSVETGDTQAYVEGFTAGVTATAPTVDVLVTYTESGTDLTLAAEAATAHIEAGADVLAAADALVVGAGPVAVENNVPWFGNQADQAGLDADLVVAAQVYHWENVLRRIVDGIEAGALGGPTYFLNLANGGLTVAYNPGFALPADIIIAAHAAQQGIIAGLVTIGG